MLPITADDYGEFLSRTATIFGGDIDLESVDFAEIGFDVEDIARPQIELLHIHCADELIALRLRVAPQPLDE